MSEDPAVDQLLRRTLRRDLAETSEDRDHAQLVAQRLLFEQRRRQAGQPEGTRTKEFRGAGRLAKRRALRIAAAPLLAGAVAAASWAVGSVLEAPVVPSALSDSATDNGEPRVAHPGQNRDETTAAEPKAPNSKAVRSMPLASPARAAKPAPVVPRQPGAERLPAQPEPSRRGRHQKASPATLQPHHDASARADATLETTASALFADASRLKRAGEIDQALATYRRLQRQFAGSREAEVSYAIVGSLLLSRSRPQQALAQFNRYRGGAVTPEVLVGRAKAFSQLGDKHRERATWQRLLASYPQSVYSERARTRLEALR